MFFLGKVHSLEHWKKYRLYQNMLQAKIVQNYNSCKKLNGRISLSPTGVELQGSKDCHFWNIIILEWEGRFTLGLNAAKNTDYIKKYFKQKLFRIKFPTKNLVNACISISPRSGAKGFERLPFLKYYDVMEWESRFTLGLNPGKNADYIKKCFKQKLFRIKHPTKNSLNAWLKDCHFWNIFMYWNGSRFTLRLSAARNMDYNIKKWFKEKSFKIKFPTKKLSGCISIFPSCRARKLQRFATKLDGILMEIWLKLNINFTQT